MSISYDVEGLIKPDKNHLSKVNAYQACLDAGVSIPDELYKYFNYEAPDECGLVKDLNDTESVTQDNDESSYWYDVDLSKIDKNIHIIRFKMTP